MASSASSIAAATVLQTADFHRALTDKKDYRLFTLDNSLEVLLVSDKNAATRSELEEEEEEDEDNNSGSLKSEEEEEEESVDDLSAHEHHTRGVGGCAVAMAVGVGSFDEGPDQDPHGLAHLLEHMLFMGSEKYPTENAYDDYLAKNGGYSNAYTEAECTVYCESFLHSKKKL